MYYIDTSVLVAFYYPEPISDRVEYFLEGCLQPTISRLTEVEFHSALARRFRLGEMTGDDAERLAASFLSHVESGMYTLLSLTDEHFRLACRWVASRKPALKSLDALHLALAATRGLTIVTADRQLAKAAEAHAVSALMIE